MDDVQKFCQTMDTKYLDELSDDTRDFFINMYYNCLSQKYSETMRKDREELRKNMTSKVCLNCGVEKSVQDFHKKATVKDGIQPYCKPCINLRKREWRKKRSDFMSFLT